MIEHGNWLIEFCEDWSQFFDGPCNWYTFRFCLVEIENDVSMGGVEAMVILLGLGFRWRWNHTNTEQRSEIVRLISDINAGRIETTPFVPPVDPT